MSYKAIYYTTARGESPVAEFVKGLDRLTRMKFYVYVEMLEAEGPNLKRPFADVVRGKIRELRPRQARALYFFAHGEKVVFVHGIVKKKDALDSGAIDMAESRMVEWLRRHGGGES